MTTEREGNERGKIREGKAKGREKRKVRGRKAWGREGKEGKGEESQWERRLTQGKAVGCKEVKRKVRARRAE